MDLERRHGRQVLWLALLMSWVACGSPDSQGPPPAASLQTDSRVLRGLRGVESAPVVGALADIDVPGFEVTRRTGQIGQFPCSRCHDAPQAPPPAADVSERWAHANIRLDHPESGTCATCHDYEDLQTLRLREGEQVSVDEAYRLCVQCHFEQGQDWVGGAHGKRVAGWRGLRVIMNCTDCHDPHAPAFEPQVPVSGPRVPRTGNAH